MPRSSDRPERTTGCRSSRLAKLKSNQSREPRLAAWTNKGRHYAGREFREARPWRGNRLVQIGQFQQGLYVSFGSISEVGARDREVCFGPMSGHCRLGHSCLKGANRRLLMRARKCLLITRQQAGSSPLRHPGQAHTLRHMFATSQIGWIAQAAP